MSLLWVCQKTPQGEIRLAVHLAFAYDDDSVSVTSACGIELDEEEWVNAEHICGPVPPALVLCSECASMTVADVDARHGRWMRGEKL